jgi:hypothetical protein
MPFDTCLIAAAAIGSKNLPTAERTDFDKGSSNFLSNWSLH